MKKLFFVLVVFVSLDASAQELFVFTEPASNMPAKSLGVRDMNAFMFRIANGKKSQLIEVEIQVIFSYNENKDGHVSRRFIQLELEKQ